MKKSYLSNAEIDEIGERLMKDYMGSSWKNLSCVDIEGFILDYLKLPVRYESFAEEDEDKIGYLADGISELTVAREGRPKRLKYPQGTVVIEKCLLQNNESSRRRFTLAHEAGHYLISQINPDQASVQFHRDYDHGKMYSPSQLSELFSLNECLADKMAAALLMPRDLLQNMLKKWNDGRPLIVYGDNVFHSNEKRILSMMADTAGVSYTSLVIRLRGMRMLEYHDFREYISRLNLKG